MTAHQLRKSILQMAVQGKLVPQDPSEEPAELLLERIRAEKQRLIQENKIKKEKNPSIIFRGADNLHYEKFSDGTVKCIKDEIPFEIPKSWRWARLGAISTYAESKKKINAQEVPPDIWLLDLEDIEKGGRLLERKTVEERTPVGDRTLFKAGNILYSKLRPYLLKVLVAPVDGVCSSEIVPFRLYGSIVSEYIVTVLKSPYIDSLINSTTYGVKMPRVSTETMTLLPIPIPPLEEQQRIMSKVNEAMTIISEYETTHTKVEHLTKIFPHHLKQSILQWAVQGKLVSQDESDELAEILLERIREEKKRLVKEGKLKKDRHESIIFRRDNSYYEKLDGAERCIDDEIPFEIPKTWAWIRLGSILEIARGGSPRPIQEYLTTEEDGVNWIKIGDTDKSQKYIYSTKEKIKPSGISKSRMVYKGDFLLTNSMSFGHPYILQIDGCIHDGWLVLCDLFSCYHVDFLYYLLSSSFAYYQFCDSVSGAVVKNLNKDKVALAIFPLPPKHEQKRIAEQIETLFAILNR